jgi:Na+/melibiose symporter-like transporter
MASQTGTSFGKLIGIIAVFTLLGIPVLAFLWETLNKLIAGVFEPWRLLVSVPVLLVFVVLLWFLARSLSRLDGIGTEG